MIVQYFYRIKNFLYYHNPIHFIIFFPNNHINYHYEEHTNSSDSVNHFKNSLLNIQKDNLKFIDHHSFFLNY